MYWIVIIPLVSGAPSNNASYSLQCADRHMITVADHATEGFERWIGRTLVRDGQTPPKNGRFVLERDIPSPHVIRTPGMAGDTVSISNRLQIVVDGKMVIVHVWKG